MVEKHVLNFLDTFSISLTDSGNARAKCFYVFKHFFYIFSNSTKTFQLTYSILYKLKTDFS